LVQFLPKGSQAVHWKNQTFAEEEASEIIGGEDRLLRGCETAGSSISRAILAAISTEGWFLSTSPRLTARGLSCAGETAAKGSTPTLQSALLQCLRMLRTAYTDIAKEDAGMQTYSSFLGSLNMGVWSAALNVISRL